MNRSYTLHISVRHKHFLSLSLYSLSNSLSFPYSAYFSSQLHQVMAGWDSKVHQRKPLGIAVTCFTGWMPFLSPNQQLKLLNAMTENAIRPIYLYSTQNLWHNYPNNL